MQWSVVQIVGWVNMTITFSRSESFTTALSMTFDGEHPCALCRLAQSQSQPDDELPSETKSELKSLTAVVWHSPSLVFTQPLVQHVRACVQCMTGMERKRPLVPPPRPQLVFI
jgi:hypothetical protein